MIDMKMLNFNAATQEAKFSQMIDLSSLCWWGDHPITEPAEVNGVIERIRDGFMLSYTVCYTSTMPCARCLTQVERRLSLDFSHLLKEATSDADEDEDGCIFINRGKLDIERLVSSDILLELEETPLCNQDCKGLCQKCGANLNEADCGCKKEEYQDPRFDVLRELLGK